jgi:hypothetical protein
MSVAATFRTVLEGMANPLPGLMEVSVWSAPLMVAPDGDWIERSSALTIPVVSVSDRPNRLPMAQQPGVGPGAVGERHPDRRRARHDVRVGDDASGSRVVATTAPALPPASAATLMRMTAAGLRIIGHKLLSRPEGGVGEPWERPGAQCLCAVRDPLTSGQAGGRTVDA